MNLKTRRWVAALVAVVILALARAGRSAEQTLQPPASNLWADGIGAGFQPGVQTLTFEAGGVYGLKILGSSQAHDLALASLSYGQMLGPVMGGDRWYRGNWELRAELFGGTQYSPSEDWIFGLTPHLRYDFATGSRWIPFVDGGAGVTATGIGRPDLSSTFEFNVQGGTGVHWFMRDNWAVTAEARYFHVSDAGTTRPNHGLNGVMGMIGLTWFF
jgi:lipid A 3-O-deacylase